MASRAISMQKKIKVVEMYTMGRSLADIQVATNYTQSMIYHALNEFHIPRRQPARGKSIAAARFLVPGLTGRLSEAHRMLIRADYYSMRPDIPLTPTVLKAEFRIGIKKFNKVDRFLKDLNLSLSAIPYPALYDLGGKRLFRLDVRELLFAYADTERWLKESAEIIKNGWKPLISTEE